MKKIMMRIKKNTFLRILSISIIAVFIALVARVTYAYFAPEFSDAWQNVGITSDLVDKFRFTIGDPLVINATTSSLPENGTNLVSESTSSASLTANNTTNKASYNYKVYFKISDNNFVYSDGSTPEIILSVTDNDNNPITNIDGLTYGTFNGVEGFDVTTANGMFMVANPNITSESSTNATVQEWHFTLTYLNLPFDQSANYNHTLKTEVILEQAKETDNTLASYIINKFTTQGVNNLYHHDGTILATEANTDAGVNVGDVIDANDGSYRYAGKYEEVNNWVCFGSNEETCPDNNLYRIIGVFDEKNVDSGATEKRVKLIMNDYAGEAVLGKAQEGTQTPYSLFSGPSKPIGDQPGYAWSGSTSVVSNNWLMSTLNTDTLNGTYLSILGDDWSNKIATTEWKVGGNIYKNIVSVNAATTYQNEIISSADSIICNKKVGLVYMHDYGFSSSPENWENALVEYYLDMNKNSNWIYRGVNEWTLSRVSDGSDTAFFIGNGVDFIEVIFLNGVRPTFYLESNVAYASGTGTQTNPYRISLD